MKSLLTGIWQNLTPVKRNDEKVLEIKAPKLTLSELLGPIDSSPSSRRAATHLSPLRILSPVVTQRRTIRFFKEERMKSLSDKLTTSMVITVILSYLEETKAISCQILNRHMYY